MKKARLLTAICIIALAFSGCFSLGGSYDVSGTVVDLEGNPVADVEVVAEAESATTATTDAQGRFSFTGLKDTATITAHKEGYLFTGPHTVKKQEKNLRIVGVAGSVETVGEGTVRVTLDDTGEATLRAIPVDPWVFIRWEGDLEGNDNPVSVTFDQPKSITAVFRNFYTEDGNVQWAPELMGLVDFWAQTYVDNRGDFEIDSAGGLLKLTMSSTYEYARLANLIVPTSAVKVRVTVMDVSAGMSSGLWRIRMINPETNGIQNAAGGTTPAKGAVETKNIPSGFISLIEAGEPIHIEFGGNWTAGEWAVFKLEFLDAEDNVVAF